MSRRVPCPPAAAGAASPGRRVPPAGRPPAALLVTLLVTLSALLLGMLATPAVAGAAAQPRPDDAPRAAPGGTPAKSAARTPARTPAKTPAKAPGKGPATEEPEFPASPLRVVLATLAPSVMPTRPDQTLRVSGRILNASDSDWSDLKVYLLTSPEPMTTTDELEEAVASDPALEIGDRLVQPGLFQVVPDLAPGESTPFRLEVPARRLQVSGEPGVYWLAVHVLGTDDQGRLEGADGRARTFLPLVPETEAGTSLALGLPLRRHTVRAGDGTLRYDRLWAEQLTGGRLDRLLRLGGSARPARGVGDRSGEDTPGVLTPSGWPVTWLVDGALLDAARSLAGGNPTVDLVARGSEVTGPATEPDEAEEAAAAAADDPDARGAARWLQRFTRSTSGSSVLALPYGDLDVSAASGDAGDAGDTGDTGDTDGPDDAAGTAMLADALVQGEASLADAGVDSEPVVAPPDGLLAPQALAALGSDVRTVLTDGVLDPGEDDGATGTVLAAPRGGSVTTTPLVDGFEGPAPGPSLGALTVRQRLLADAALHALSPERDEPLVRVLPARWDPGPAWRSARFFDGLDVPWLQAQSLATLTDPAAVGSAEVAADDVTYPDEAEQAEVPAYAVAAAADLVERSQTLGELLTEDTTTARQLDRQALLTASYWSRDFPGVATDRARDASARVDGWLSRVSIRGPSFVTMSSERGSFQVTMVNGLDLPVTVGLAADPGSAPLTLTTPDPVDLPPGGRLAMDIDADVTDIGVHQVTLQPVSTTGRPVGQQTTLSVRSSSVGLILWIIMAVGAVTLFGAISVRTVRRVRTHRRRRTA